MSDKAFPSFRKGTEALKEQSKGGGQFAKTNFFQVEDGKTAYLRFLTDFDKVITVDQHQNIPTKKKPEGYDGNWPERMSAVCRKTDIEDPENPGTFIPWHDECYICDFLVGTKDGGRDIKKPSARGWALAVLRKEVLGDGSEELGGPDWKGRRVWFEDETREIVKTGKDGKPTGETFIEKALVVVNMGSKNFFSRLDGIGGHNGTILDRDMWVKRSGGGTDTDYSIIPEDPIEMDDGSRLDLRNDEHMKEYGFDSEEQAYEALSQIVAERADDEFYARFFDPRYTVSDDKIVGTGAAPEAKPSNDVEDQEKLAALADRLKGYGPSKGAKAEEAAAEEAAEEPETPAPAKTAAKKPAPASAKPKPRIKR